MWCSGKPRIGLQNLTSCWHSLPLRRRWQRLETLFARRKKDIYRNKTSPNFFLSLHSESNIISRKWKKWSQGSRQANEKRVEGLNKGIFYLHFWNSYMIFRFIASSVPTRGHQRSKSRFSGKLFLSINLKILKLGNYFETIVFISSSRIDTYAFYPWRSILKFDLRSRQVKVTKWPK